MGDSHYKSNMVGKNGTETISNFASIATGTVSGTTTVTGAGVVATNYVKIGTRYILSGTNTTSASIVAEASLLIGKTKQGSLYLGVGHTWVFISDGLASPLTT